jgi:predicted lipoprotein with Yx(FWY)xxD motif
MPAISYPPPTPPEISVVQESNSYVFCVGEARAIYSNDADSRGKSRCNDGCSKIWPPVRANNDSRSVGFWTVLVRLDGSRQWAYKGRPVYTYSKDVAGKAMGDGIKGIWHQMKP